MSRTSKHEALWVSLVAVGVVAHIDLSAALLSGALIWLVLTCLRAHRGALHGRAVQPSEAAPALRERLQRAGLIQLVQGSGPLSFLSVARIDAMISDVPPWPRYLILDLRGVTSVDSSALRALEQALDGLEARSGQLLLVSSVETGPMHAALRLRSLGERSCRTVPQALQRIAERQPESSSACLDGRTGRPVLRLVRAAVDPE